MGPLASSNGQASAPLCEGGAATPRRYTPETAARAAPSGARAVSAALSATVASPASKRGPPRPGGLLRAVGRGNAPVSHLAPSEPRGRRTALLPPQLPAPAPAGALSHPPEYYRDKTLKLAHEASAFSLLAEGWPLSKFEASDVVVFNKSLYFVCDSTFSLMKTGFGLEPLSPENELIGLPERNGSLESDWEALWVDDVTGVFYVVREAITHNFDEEDREEALETEQPEQPKAQSQKRKGRKKPFHAHIEELTLHGNTYTLEATCTTEFSFSAGNKGLEGLVGFRGPKGEIYLLGLCEGNFCKGGEKGRTPGNGRMVLMQKETDGQKCTWKTLKVLELPSEISFPDYSAVTTRGNRIAIASQEGSTLWIGKINQEEVTDDKGQRSVVLSSPEELEVLPGGRVLHFPRDESCEIMYCNIEGIAFINDRLIAAGGQFERPTSNVAVTCGIHSTAFPSRGRRLTGEPSESAA
ncbi:uncharacterized protein LOC34620013 [Cyclospora cayetanensis]|uniref:Uncharacterized protein LOC34620013 n=1 Tax=Cyclospora cayetanensis TaxID=88456 RepID=A0A6P6S046_9EIME|nr:uncharacterized protein LOC34620013 [Cyclospora cayetanensis]